MKAAGFLLLPCFTKATIKGPVFVSCDCCSKLSPTAICPLTALETSTPKTRCQQQWVPLEALRESPSNLSPSFCWAWQSLASLGLEAHHSHLRLSSHCAFLPFSPLTKTLVMGFRTHSNQDGFILRSLQRPFPNRVTATGSG